MTIAITARLWIKAMAGGGRLMQVNGGPLKVVKVPEREAGC